MQGKYKQSFVGSEAPKILEIQSFCMKCDTAKKLIDTAPKKQRLETHKELQQTLHRKQESSDELNKLYQAAFFNGEFKNNATLYGAQTFNSKGLLNVSKASDLSQKYFYRRSKKTKWRFRIDYFPMYSVYSTMEWLAVVKKKFQEILDRQHKLKIRKRNRIRYVRVCI